MTGDKLQQSAAGKKGGKIGGKARAATLSQAQRKAIAKKAAQTRWKKTKGKGKQVS